MKTFILFPNLSVLVFGKLESVHLQLEGALRSDLPLELGQHKREGALRSSDLSLELVALGHAKPELARREHDVVLCQLSPDGLQDHSGAAVIDTHS